MNQTISVIVPVYKVANYLSKCIDSIINQSYSNLEIILVDDGSPDSCGQICDNYAASDNRIKVIHKENGGVSDARNAGLSMATGYYVSFVDSDDYIKSRFFHILLDMISKYDLDIAQCDYQEIFEDHENDIESSINLSDNISVYNKYEALSNLYNQNCTKAVVLWNKLYKRSLFKNILFPKVNIHEDEYTIYKIFFNAKKVGVISVPLYYYLQRSNSLVSNIYKIQSFKIIFSGYMEQIDFYQQNKLINLEYLAKTHLENRIFFYIYQIANKSNKEKKKLLKYIINYYKKNINVFEHIPSKSLHNRFVMKVLFFPYSFILSFNKLKYIKMNYFNFLSKK